MIDGNTFWANNRIRKVKGCEYMISVVCRVSSLSNILMSKLLVKNRVKLSVEN